MEITSLETRIESVETIKSKELQDIESQEVRESSLISAESGVVTGEERESSLESEQIKELKEKEKEKIKVKKSKEGTPERPRRYKKPKVESRIDTGDRRPRAEDKTQKVEKKVRERKSVEDEKRENAKLTRKKRKKLRQLK